MRSKEPDADELLSMLIVEVVVLMVTLGAEARASPVQAAIIKSTLADEKAWILWKPQMEVAIVGGNFVRLTCHFPISRRVFMAQCRRVVH